VSFSPLTPKDEKVTQQPGTYHQLSTKFPGQHYPAYEAGNHPSGLLDEGRKKGVQPSTNHTLAGTNPWIWVVNTAELELGFRLGEKPLLNVVSVLSWHWCLFGWDVATCLGSWAVVGWMLLLSR
jgi:hypothetical protein